jgi:hypothetical protein
MSTTEYLRLAESLDAEISYGSQPVIWPTLLPLLNSEPSVPDQFPFSALGKILGAAAYAIATDVQAPGSLAAGGVLAAASLAAQSHANVMMPFGQTAPLSLILISSATSGDRKSAVDQMALKAVHQIRDEQLRDQARLAAALEEDRRGKRDAAVAQQKFQTLTTGNATVEGLCRLLKNQSHVGIFSAEGGEVLGGHSLRDDKRSAGLAFFLKGWGGEYIDSLRAGDGHISLLGRRMTMHILVQPVLLKMLLTDPLADGQGLLSRCLISQPDSLAGHRPFRMATEQSKISNFHNVVAKLLRTKPRCVSHGDGFELDPRNLKFSEEAMALWTEFYNEVESKIAVGRELEGARPFVCKAAEHAARIAGIIAMIEDPGTAQISKAQMDGGIEVASFYLTEHVRLTGASQEQKKVSSLRDLLDWILSRGSFVSNSELLQKSPHAIRRLKADRIGEMMTELAQRGYVQPSGKNWLVRDV